MMCKKFLKGREAAALLRVPSLIAALLLLFASCPMMIPEKVRVKANPAIYLPLGSPDSFADINFDFSKMADVSVGAGGDTLVCDYPGEFPETRAFLIWTGLVEHSFPDPGLPPPLPGAPSVSFPIQGIPPGTSEGINLGDLQGILKEYPGLQFRSVIGYLYFDGPATLLKKGELSLELAIEDGAGQALQTPSQYPLLPTPLPDPLPSGEPVTQPLSPKPAAMIDLTGILNNQDNSELNFAYSINGRSEIEIPPEDLPAFREELNTPLRVYLAIVLPLRFTAAYPIPVLAGDPAIRQDKGAIVTSEDGKDLFGREGGDTSDTLQKILNNMSALSLTISITNKLGIEGFLTMNRGISDRDPLSPMEDALGRINLTGNSAVTLTKDEIERTNPFNPVFELFLEGDFDIKRGEAGGRPLEMTLGMVVQTAIDKVF